MPSFRTGGPTIFRAAVSVSTRGSRLNQREDKTGRPKAAGFDYKAPAVIARRKFHSEDFVDSLKVTSATNDVTAIRPTAEGQRYIKGLRSR